MRPPRHQPGLRPGSLSTTTIPEQDRVRQNDVEYTNRQAHWTAGLGLARATHCRSRSPVVGRRSRPRNRPRRRIERVGRRAEALAQLLEEKQTAVSGRSALDEAFMRLYSRPATEDEAKYCLEFINGPEGDWQQLAQVLLAANEMMYID